MAVFIPHNYNWQNHTDRSLVVRPQIGANLWLGVITLEHHASPRLQFEGSKLFVPIETHLEFGWNRNV